MCLGLLANKPTGSFHLYLLSALLGLQLYYQAYVFLLTLETELQSSLLQGTQFTLSTISLAQEIHIMWMGLLTTCVLEYNSEQDLQ